MLAPDIAPPAPRHRVAVELGSLILVMLLPVLLVSPRLQDHPRQTITVRNPTDIHVRVDVRGSQQAGTSPIGLVPAGGQVTIRDVWDEGDTWIFSFRGQRHHLGDITLSRSDLDANGWTIDLPESVGQRIHDLDLPPSPG